MATYLVVCRNHESVGIKVVSTTEPTSCPECGNTDVKVILLSA